MGPMGAGKTLISKELAKKIGYNYLSIDEFKNYIIYPEATSNKSEFISYLRKNLSYITYNFDNIKNIKFSYKNNGYDNPFPDNLSIMIEQAYDLDIMLTVIINEINCSKKEVLPFVIDATPLVGLNIDCSKIQTSLSDDELIDICGYTRDSLNKDISENLSDIGYRVLLVPENDYDKVAYSTLKNAGNQVVLKNLNTMYDYATIVTSVDDVFNELDNKVFKEERNKEDLSIKQKLLNRGTLNNTVEQIANFINDLNEYKEK